MVVAAATTEAATVGADGASGSSNSSQQTAIVSGHASFQAAAAGPAPQTGATSLSQTVARLSTDLVKKLQAKASKFDLALEPEGMGRVDVKIRIAADGALSAAMSFDNPHTAEALKARSAELRTALEQAGFNLADSGLSFTAGGSGRQASGQDNSAPTPQRSSIRTAEAPESPSPVPTARVSAGGLDMRI